MEPARLQEIIEPLETLLVNKEFHLDGEPLVDGTMRMASFIRADGAKVDYSLDVKKDDDSLPYVSTSNIFLQADLYINGKVVSLNPSLTYSSTRTTLSIVESIVDDDIKPNLEEHL